MRRDDPHVGDSGRLPIRMYPAVGSRPAEPVPRSRQSTHLACKENTCRVKYFIGVRGDIVTQSDLPSPSTKRWVIRRKAEIVLAVEGGLLSLEDACQRYQLTREEFSSWKNAVEQHGLMGLRSTHLQDFRRPRTWP